MVHGGQVLPTQQTVTLVHFLRIPALLLSLALLLALPTAAAADQPREIPLLLQVEGFNPCSGEGHTVTLDYTLRIHEHANAVVITYAGHVSSDDGFSAIGRGVQVETTRVFKDHAHSVMVNPDTGERFTANITFVEDVETGDVRIDRADFKCVSP